MRGFTLPEVITVMVVAVVIGGLVLGIMVQNTRVFVTESQKVSQGVGLNDGLSQIKNEVKKAKAVATSYTSGQTTYTASSDILVLQIPSIDSSGNIIANTYDISVFIVTGGNLSFKLFPDSQSTRTSSDQILTKNVDSINFKYLDVAGLEVSPPSSVKVKVTLSLKQTAGLNTQTSIGTSEASLRND